MGTNCTVEQLHCTVGLFESIYYTCNCRCKKEKTFDNWKLSDLIEIGEGKVSDRNISEQVQLLFGQIQETFLREIQEPFLERFLYLTKQKLHLFETSMLQYLMVCYQRNLTMSMAGQFFILQTKPEKRSPMPRCRENTNSRSDRNDERELEFPAKKLPPNNPTMQRAKKTWRHLRKRPKKFNRDLTGSVICQTDLSLNALPPTCKTEG